MVTTRSSNESQERDERSDAVSSAENGENEENLAHQRQGKEVEYHSNYPTEDDVQQSTGAMSLQERVEQLEKERAELIKVVRAFKASSSAKVVFQVDSSEVRNKKKGETHVNAGKEKAPAASRLKGAKEGPAKRDPGLPPRAPVKAHLEPIIKPAGETFTPQLIEQEKIAAAVKAALLELAHREMRTS